MRSQVRFLLAPLESARSEHIFRSPHSPPNRSGEQIGEQWICGVLLLPHRSPRRSWSASTSRGFVRRDVPTPATARIVGVSRLVAPLPQATAYQRSARCACAPRPHLFRRACSPRPAPTDSLTNRRPGRNHSASPSVGQLSARGNTLRSRCSCVRRPGTRRTSIELAEARSCYRERR